MWGFWKKKEPLNRRWLYIALAAFVAMLVVNAIAGSTNWMGGVTTAEVSDSFPNLFAPAGYTFAIWGVIYLALTVFVARLFGVVRTDKKPLATKQLNEVVKLFAVSSLLNAAWLFAWQYKVMWLSVILMVLLLVVLLKIFHMLHTQTMGPKERLFVGVPFSIYAGWISVATIANVTTWLASIQWNGWGLSDGTWMVAVLLVGAVIGLVTALRFKDWVYLVVFVWAYAGILVKHLSPAGFDGKYPSTIVALTILLAVFVSVGISIASSRMVRSR